MAKKAKRKVRTKVITKTRRVFVNAKRKGRAIRRAAGERMNATDIILAVGGAGVGSIGGSLILAKMPEAVPDLAKNGILAALGGFAAYKGLKKKNKLLLGLGMGAAAAAATNIIGNVISGSSTVNGAYSNLNLAAPYATLAAPYSGLNGAASNFNLAAPLAAPIDGEEC